MKQSKLHLLFYTLAHAVVDAMCAITVLQDRSYFSPAELLCFLVIYNFLAFATQPIAGLFIDDTPHKKEIILASFGMLFLGFALPAFQIVRVVIVGVANCLFHVAAGADVLEQSNHKMWPLGVFVSTGAVGLAVGMAYPSDIFVQTFFLSLLLLVSIGVCILRPLKAPKIEVKNTTVSKIFWVVSALLLFCITIRSFMGFARMAPFKGIAFLPLIMAVFVFAGKAMGGFFCDKFSTKWVIFVSVPLSALLYFMGDSHFIVWGLAQFFVNISMPITLYLLYKAMPHAPAFSFGLAASFLLPGLVVALIIPKPIPDWVFAIIFVLNFACLWVGNKVLSEKRSLRHQYK